MKHVLLFSSMIVASMLLACCGNSSTTSNKYGESGANAIQYVTESTDIQSENIESIDITSVDSLLTDDILDEKAFKEKCDAFYEQKISKDEFGKIVDEAAITMRDLYSSWRYGERNDSLRKLSQYNGAWRLVYTITVTTKSTAQHNVRVLMKEDGITPLMTEKDFKEKMNKRSGLIEAMTTKLNWDW
ncbi:MAG: hypothetical protein IKR05_10910 [Prevotella sp.]|nr:hypothetical protein [Prevotella sp.]MBR6263706.1 hypothetical protein [Prevotella sp.]